MNEPTSVPRRRAADGPAHRTLAFFTDHVMTEVEAWLQNPTNEEKAVLAAAALYQVTDYYWQSLPVTI